MMMEITTRPEAQPKKPRQDLSEKGFVIQTIRVNSGEHLVNYCYLLVNRVTRQAAVIDPAWEIGKIQTVLQARNCQLSAILLTHHHRDHTDLADELATATGAEVYMSSSEIACYSFVCTNLRAISGSRIECAGLKINVIDTPGHTTGSVCFSIGGHLFTGDTLFIEGCGDCTGWGSSSEKLFESLTLLVSKFPDRTRIYPGHRFGQAPGKTFAYVKENNIYLKVRDVSEFKSLHMRKRNKAAIRYL